MKKLLFSAEGRLNRAPFWKGVLIVIGGWIVVSVICGILGMLIPNESTEAGMSYKANGPAAIPFLVLIMGYWVVSLWAGICLGIKRYHDRDKSGAWVLIQLVPFIGPIWYLVEAGFLEGTPGPNRFGPDPRGAVGQIAAAF